MQFVPVFCIQWSVTRTCITIRI
uniref:Uncharacterized protein n=1 Tax=Anguilla anguilla TaxID=7936 RepID=A0A0E9QMX9_ANGAN